MRRAIIDEFQGKLGVSGKPLSRQRLWQLRKKKEGKCIICGAKRATANHCRKHANEYNRRLCESLGLTYHGRIYQKKTVDSTPNPV
jgi:hypothetical protein